MSSTGEEKKRKSAEGEEEDTKFQSIVKTFMKNQDNNFLDWLSANGIPDYEIELADGEEEPTAVQKGRFSDEMSHLLNGFVYDIIIHLKEDEKDGLHVPTLKSSKEPNKTSKFFGEIEKGPSHYVSPAPCAAEGEEEIEIKKKARRLNGYNRADLARSCSIGGAISASDDAKELLGHLMNLRRAHLVQLSMIAASSDQKKTIKKKHVKMAIASEGITVV